MSQHNESKQHSQNYIAQVCEQVRWKKAHDVVSEELLAHIEDQAEAYREEGYTEDEAEYLAVEQMGDPVLAGSQFDKVYKPRMEWNVLCLAGTIILLGTVLRLMLQVASGMPVDWGSELLKILVGLPFLVLGYCLDYTALLSGKMLAIFSWIVVILTAKFSNILRIDLARGFNIVYYAIPLWIVLFVVTINYMRQKGAIGFLLAFAEIMLVLLSFVFVYSIPMSGVMVWLGTCFIIMMYALKVNWFGCKKRLGLTFLLYPIILAGFVIGHPHRIDRIKSMFSPGSDAFGYSFIPGQIYDILQNASLIGPGNLDLMYVVEHLYNAKIVHSNYILTASLSHWGWISILLIVGSYIGLFSFCILASRKVKSKMGKLLMVSITSCWIMQFVSYLLINLTTFQMSAYPLLFVQSGWMSMINLFLLGILLSVYKTGAVQKDSQPVIKMRKMKMKEQFFS